MCETTSLVIGKRIFPTKHSAARDLGLWLDDEREDQPDQTTAAAVGTTRCNNDNDNGVPAEGSRTTDFSICILLYSFIILLSLDFRRRKINSKMYELYSNF